jgi:6-phosphogluconolactonase
MKREIKRYPNLAALGNAAAESICALAVKCVNEHGVFSVALSGGNTPMSLYESLTGPPYETRMPWSHIHIFWGDERCVPSDHPDSNFAMASRALISKVRIPPRNVHRIPGEVEPPEDAAATYEKILRGFFGSNLQGDTHSHASSVGESFPSFDVILLGMGKDGHTASLFPGDEALEEEKRWMTAVRNPRCPPPVPRITLTLPVINRAQCILFLVSGSGKGNVLDAILDDPHSAARLYPAARVVPDGRAVWFIDEETV